jgi:hypothetical protein
MTAPAHHPTPEPSPQRRADVIKAQEIAANVQKQQN